MKSSYLANRKTYLFKKPKQAIDRLRFLTVLFFIVTIIIIGRLAQLQILQHNIYQQIATRNLAFFQELFPTRGEIYVQDQYSSSQEYKIVMNQDLSIVYADPWLIKEKNEAVNLLEPYISLTKDELNNKLEPTISSEGRKNNYVVLEKKVAAPQKTAIADLKIKGIAFANEKWRYYLSGDYTAHLTGFLGMGEKGKTGQYGLEGFFNNELTGTPGHLLEIGGNFEPAVNGSDLHLTIDKNIQFYGCDKLRTAIEKHLATMGSLLVMDPNTGAILANCTYPVYDPNNYSDVEDQQIYVDKTIGEAYEPGSVFKAFSMGAALDLNKVNPYTTYNDTGEIYVNGWPKPIKNSHGSGNGIQTMSQVLEKSLNTGSVYTVQQVGNEAWYQYVHNLGFGEKTGIELDGEVKGDISSLEQFKDIYSATSSFGQGITVTPLQLITAYASIANGGKLLKPYIVDYKEKDNGYQEKTEDHEVRQVFSAQTSRMLSAMLTNVVENGSGKSAGVKGYFMAGKTGTAQIVKEDGSGYDASRHKDTYVGYGPVSNPRFIILVKIDDPQNALWAENTTAPLAGEISKYILEYYKIPPDRE